MNREKFLADVLRGLQSSPKLLQSKYFYDKKGDDLFVDIMRSNEYYLTRCELEIFTRQRKAIADAVLQTDEMLDLVALGPGDSSKTIHLIEELVNRKRAEKYFPIDISGHVIDSLRTLFAQKFPELTFHGLSGEYFQMLSEVMHLSNNKRVVFFVGATIGNFSPEEMLQFCRNLRQSLRPGDMVLIGFDLKKDPRVILAAYNDSQGLTAQFNLNLLRRINDELGADFCPDNFAHFPSYEPLTGACRSFLISEKKHQVRIGNHPISFDEGEPIYMEVSQKYTPEEIEEASASTGFRQVASFTDERRYFLDVLWQAV